MTRRVLVVGAGGIGGLLASRLAADPKNDVVLGVRRETPRVVFTADGETSEPPVQVVSTAEGLAGFDWVVVATKAYDTVGLGPWLGAECCASAAVAVAQNGVEQVERMAPYARAERVLPVIVTYGAERPEPGRIVQTLSGVLRVADTDLGHSFAELTAGTGLDLELVADFTTALWTKLCWNLVGNSLTTITDLPVREIGLRPELRWLAERLVEECCAVAEKQGAVMEPGLVQGMLSTFAAYPETVRSSMWQDRDAGRRFEHDAISGAVVRAAERVGLDAPYSQMATKLLETFSPQPA